MLRLPMAEHHNTFAVVCPTSPVRLSCHDIVATLLEDRCRQPPLRCISLLSICRHDSACRGDKQKPRLAEDPGLLASQENCYPGSCQAGPEVHTTGILSATLVTCFSQVDGQCVVLQKLQVFRQPLGRIDNTVPVAGQVLLFCLTWHSAGARQCHLGHL